VPVAAVAGPAAPVLLPALIACFVVCPDVWAGPACGAARAPAACVPAPVVRGSALA
jgi:hypothetical protein